ncbi:hypothetical protein H8959_017200 [Pygathrix nigripes]
MDKKCTHRNPEDAKAGKYEGKHKRKKKRKQNQNQHRSQHRSVTSFSSDDRVFPSSSSSSSGSQTDSSTEVMCPSCKGSWKSKIGFFSIDDERHVDEYSLNIGSGIRY